MQRWVEILSEGVFLYINKYLPTFLEDLQKQLRNFSYHDPKEFQKYIQNYKSDYTFDRQTIKYMDNVLPNKDVTFEK